MSAAVVSRSDVGAESSSAEEDKELTPMSQPDSGEELLMNSLNAAAGDIARTPTADDDKRHTTAHA